MVRRSALDGLWYDRVEPFIERPDEWSAWTELLFELDAWDSLFDRSGAMPHPLRMENLRPLPAFRSDFDDSLEALCAARVAEVSALARDRAAPVRLFWSGGIDSTLVVTSFLKWGPPPDQLELVYTDESEREYPGFLATFVPEAVRRVKVGAFPHHQFVSDHDAERFRDRPCMGDFLDPLAVNVTGGLGDKLFNSHMLLKRFGYHRAFEPYENVVSERLVDLTRAFVANSPLPTRTLFDFCWWVYFSLNFQDELLQVLAGVSGDTVEPRRRALQVFFDTEPFQQWSMHHRDRVATDDPTRLKYDAKWLIYQYTRDEQYLLTKLKAGSLKFRKTPNREWDNPILFILEDGEVVRARPG